MRWRGLSGWLGNPAVSTVAPAPRPWPPPQNLDYTLVECQALVLAPTRELAQQIEKVMRALGDYLSVKCHACVGGTSVREDTRILQVWAALGGGGDVLGACGCWTVCCSARCGGAARGLSEVLRGARRLPTLLTPWPASPNHLSAQGGVHVVVGTPGRVYDMLRRRALRADSIKMFVLDEADEMLSRGFKDQIYDIFQLLPPKIQVRTGGGRAGAAGAGAVGSWCTRGALAGGAAACVCAQHACCNRADRPGTPLS